MRYWDQVRLRPSDIERPSLGHTNLTQRRSFSGFQLFRISGPQVFGSALIFANPRVYINTEGVMDASSQTHRYIHCERTEVPAR